MLPTPPTRRHHCKFDGCGKSFSTSGQLSRHNRIHKGVKNFHCTYPGCDRQFFRADNRQQHLLSHEKKDQRQQLLKQAHALLDRTPILAGSRPRAIAMLDSPWRFSPHSTPASPPESPADNLLLSQIHHVPMNPMMHGAERMSSSRLPVLASSPLASIKKTSVQFLCE